MTSPEQLHTNLTRGRQTENKATFTASFMTHAVDMTVEFIKPEHVGALRF